MKQMNYIIINESNTQTINSDALGSIMPDFRNSHFINAAGLTRPQLISVLILARKQWPDAKILGISELGLQVRDQQLTSCGRLCPSDAMNSIRRELSDHP